MLFYSNLLSAGLLKMFYGKSFMINFSLSCMCSNCHSADSSGSTGSKASDKSKLVLDKENTEIDIAKQTEVENDGGDKAAKEKQEDAKEGRGGGNGGDGNGKGIGDGTGKGNDGNEGDEDGKYKNFQGNEDGKSIKDDASDKMKKRSKAALLDTDCVLGKTL